MRMVGSVRNSGRSPEDAKTLRDCKYQIGDHLDIAVMDEGGAGLRGYGGGGGRGGGGYRNGGDGSSRRDMESRGRGSGGFRHRGGTGPDFLDR